MVNPPVYLLVQECRTFVEIIIISFVVRQTFLKFLLASPFSTHLTVFFSFFPTHPLPNWSSRVEPMGSSDYISLGALED